MATKKKTNKKAFEPFQAQEIDVAQLNKKPSVVASSTDTKETIYYEVWLGKLVVSSYDGEDITLTSNYNEADQYGFEGAIAIADFCGGQLIRIERQTVTTITKSAVETEAEHVWLSANHPEYLEDEEDYVDEDEEYLEDEDEDEEEDDE